METRFVDESVYIPFYVNIPANQTKLKKMGGTSQLSGRLTKIIINIPDGWDITAGIQIRVGKRQTLPMPDSSSESSEVFSGNNIPLELKPNIEVREESLEIWALNDDTINAHDCFITFEVTTTKEIKI